MQSPVSSVKTSEKVEVVEEPVDLSWNEEITQNKLDDAWRKYSMRFQQTNPRLYSILDNHKPVLVGDNKLLINLRNQIQENELLKEKSGMSGYLKRALKNAGLQLEFKISIGEQDGPKKAFTVADKFKLMAEKNPDLIKFKQEFGLDLE